MSENNNVNDSFTVNKVSHRNHNNDNVIGAKYAKSKLIENSLAPELAKKLNADEGSMSFIYKCFWKLSEAKIWSNAELAQKGRNKMALFIFLCKKDGV